MYESLTFDHLLHIQDEAEQVFAFAFILAFPQIQLIHHPCIIAKSGNKNRITVPDFELRNEHNQRLFIEITKGHKKTKRKRKQQKTANLAGFGGQFAIVYGNDIDRISTSSSEHIRDAVLATLKGKYNSTLFLLQ